MTTSIPLSQLESSPAAKFEKLGDTYTGRIVSLDETRQTDPVTGDPKTFPSGDPMYLWVITIEQDNGEAVALWAKGGKYTAAQGSGQSMLAAIGEAVKKAGANSVDVGGKLAVRHSGLSEAKAGLNPAKLYMAQYEAPTQSVSADDMFGSGDESPF